MVLWVFKLRRKKFNLLLFVIKLSLYIDDLLSKLWNQWNLLLNNLKLSLSLFKLEVDHSNFFLLLSDFLFSVLKNVLLNVTLLVKNTELVIFINKLNTHIVTGFTGHFVFEYEVIHFFLKRIDD